VADKDNLASHAPTSSVTLFDSAELFGTAGTGNFAFWRVDNSSTWHSVTPLIIVFVRVSPIFRLSAPATSAWPNALVIESSPLECVAVLPVLLRDGFVADVGRFAFGLTTVFFDPASIFVCFTSSILVAFVLTGSSLRRGTSFFEGAPDSPTPVPNTGQVARDLFVSAFDAGLSPCFVRSLSGRALATVSVFADTSSFSAR